MYNEANPSGPQMSFYEFLGNIHTPGCTFFNGVIVVLASLWLDMKITIVQTKYKWELEDKPDLGLILAHFNGTYMTTKVGKYLFVNL